MRKSIRTVQDPQLAGRWKGERTRWKVHTKHAIRFEQPLTHLHYHLIYQQKLHKDQLPDSYQGEIIHTSNNSTSLSWGLGVTVTKYAPQGMGRFYTYLEGVVSVNVGPRVGAMHWTSGFSHPADDLQDQSAVH
jgi:hypothetical protein